MAKWMHGTFLNRWEVEYLTGMRVFESCLFEECQTFILVKENMKIHIAFFYEHEDEFFLSLHEFQEDSMPKCSDFEYFCCFDCAGFEGFTARQWKVVFDEDKKKEFVEVYDEPGSLVS